jgi:hypothetical protein
MFDIEAELATSVAAGMTEAKGSGRILNDENRSNKSLRQYLAYQTTTKDELSKIQDVSLKHDVLDLELLENDFRRCAALRGETH